MDKNTHNPWALMPGRNWKAASNTLDTLLYRELIQAELRRRTENESLIQSAFTIHHNMKCLADDEGHQFSAPGSNPDGQLLNHICQILELPAQSIRTYYPNRVAS
jgi:hypothetical protein